MKYEDLKWYRLKDASSTFVMGVPGGVVMSDTVNECGVGMVFIPGAKIGQFFETEVV